MRNEMFYGGAAGGGKGLEQLRAAAEVIAAQLVADALSKMCGLPVTLAVTPRPSATGAQQLGTVTRRALPPAPAERRARKTGLKRKPKRKTRAPAKRGRWSPAQHAKFRRTMDLRRAGWNREGRALRPRKAKAVEPATPREAKFCLRCDHAATSHPDGQACLVKGCVCTDLYV